MKHLRFSFDVISPYAYLAFERLPEVLQGINCTVSYEPVLLAGLLRHFDQKGPAEIAPKRDWTYRQVSWQAAQLQLPLQLPVQHPFNPLALLRMLLACAPEGLSPSRWACEQALHHVWRSGADANEPGRLADLSQRLKPRRDPQGREVKEALQTATEQAAARGVFGVPSVEVDGRLFWGLDGLEMLRGYLSGDPWFEGSGWSDAAQPRAGVERKH